MSSERQQAEAKSRWWGEHVHRYNEALKYIGPQDRVLDIACGTGFGTDIIASKTSGLVIGGDIAQDAIEECRQSWKKENLSFEVIDGTKMKYVDGYFDVIVSFETIEHTTQYRQMLAEFARTIRPGGKLVLSTPNSTITSPDGVIPNPYHTQEFNHDELKAILSEVFPSVELMGQRYTRYDNKSLRRNTGKMFESICMTMGIRKLPVSWRSGVMSALFGYPLYPRENDFILEKNTGRIKGECPVLFAVCQK